MTRSDRSRHGDGPHVVYGWSGQLTVSAGVRPTSARLLVASTAAELDRADAEAYVIIPGILDHEVVAVEFEREG